MSIKHDLKMGGRPPGLGLASASADSTSEASVVSAGGTMHLAHVLRRLFGVSSRYLIEA